MKELKEMLELELAKFRALCSTDNSFDYAYCAGIEFALRQIEELNKSENSNDNLDLKSL